MSKEEKSNLTTGALARFGSGGDLGPVEDRNEYDQRLKSLPAGNKELAEESARFADLCQYFEPGIETSDTGTTRSHEEAEQETNGVPE